MLNKIDMIDEDELAERREALLAALDWQGPVYEIAAISGEGTDLICQNMMVLLEEQAAAEAADPELAAAESEIQSRMQQEARDRIEQLRAQHRAARDDDDPDDDEDDDDFDVEVEYAP